MARKRRSRASRAHASPDTGADADHLLGSSLDDSYLDNLLAGLDRLSVSPSTVAAAQLHSPPGTTAAGGSTTRRRSNRPALHPITSVPTSPAATVAGIGHAGTSLHVPVKPPAAATAAAAVPQTPPATSSGSAKSGKRGRKSSTTTTPTDHRPPQFLLRPRPVSPSPLPLRPTATNDSDTSDIDPDDPAILAATAAQRRRREQKRAKRSSKRQQHQEQPDLFAGVALDNAVEDSDVDLSDTESIVELRTEVEALFVHSQMQVLCPWYLPMFDIVKVEREECAERGSPEYGTGGLGGFVGARSGQLERLGKWGHPSWDCLVPVPEEGDEWRWVVSIGDE